MLNISDIKKNIDSYTTIYCERCDNYFCSECIYFIEVKFNIIENVVDGLHNTPKKFVNFKGKKVCPKCYIILYDKHNKGLLRC